MAELNNASNETTTSKKIRSRKLSSKVDLTAMVDLAFLLITFFMLTTSLSESRAMDLVMPSDGPNSPVDENRTLTLLIDKNNKVRAYMGQFQMAKAKEIQLGDSRYLRAEISKRKKEVLAYSSAKGTPEKGLIVLIKPGTASNYGNLVDVLDEMAISNVDTFSITDLMADEKQLLAQK